MLGDNENMKRQQMLGKRVMNALRDLRYKATISELCSHIANVNKKPCELIRPEVKRVLNHGIQNGFFIRSEKHYSLPHSYHVDGDDREYSPEEELAIAACDQALKHIGDAKRDLPSDRASVRAHLSKAQDSINEVVRTVATYMTHDALDKAAEELDREGALTQHDKNKLLACKILKEDLNRKRAKLRAEKSKESEEEFEEDDEDVEEEASSSRKRKATAAPAPGCSISSTSRPSPSKHVRK